MPAHQIYGIGILGNCCTHGAGVAHQIRNHPRVNLIAGYEKNAGRAAELEEVMGVSCASSYERVVRHPDVHIIAITSDPSDKAELVDLATDHGKAVYINKPLCHTPTAAIRIKDSIQAAGSAAVFDATLVKGLPAFNKLMHQIKKNEYGRIITYHHSCGMIFPEDFPIIARWPERFDPPERSGGGEMTNMGCYGIDYAIHVLGLPDQVEARKQTFWKPYIQAGVENFGQIILDYGDFWATLSVGKQAVSGEPGKRNALTIEFETGNLFLDPGADTYIENGIAKPLASYIADHKVKSPFDQLIDQMEKGIPPESDIESAVEGVYILCAAYQSIISRRSIRVPLEQPVNPLFEIYKT